MKSVEKEFSKKPEDIKKEDYPYFDDKAFELYKQFLQERNG